MQPPSSSDSASRPLGEWVAALASGSPTPGGGAASALVGALAVALAEMVAQLTVGRPKYQAVEARVRELLTRAQTLRSDLMAQMDADASAYASVASAYRLPRATDDERASRERAIQAALRAAMEPPLRVMRLSGEVATLASESAAIGNPMVASDAGCAAIFAEAAARSARLNVLANAVLLHDATEQVRWRIRWKPR